MVRISGSSANRSVGVGAWSESPDEQHRLAHQKIRGEPLHRLVGIDDGEIDLAARDQIAQVAAGLLADADRDLRIGPAEGADDRHAEQHARRRRNADGDLAARLARRRRDVIPERAQLSLEPAQSLLQSLARLGRRHAASMANEQGRIELPLERVDLPAQGRLRDAQRLGRAADVPVLDDRQKILDLATVEGHGLPRLSRNARYSIFVSD